MAHRHSVAIAVLCLLWQAYSFSSSSTGQAAEAWLQSSGKDLRIPVQGEVLETDGGAAKEIAITAGLNGAGSNQQLQPKTAGNRFEMVVPANEAMWPSLWVRAASADGERVAYLMLGAFELRQAAIDGLKLTLQSPTRNVQVRVLQDGRPVPDAMVKAELGLGIELRVRTDAKGIARFRLLPQDRLSYLTAWTEDFRIGGFSFSRQPARDPDADEQVVELSKCRAQKLRFVDEHGSPVAGIGFVLEVATGSPDYNFIGTNEHSHLTTDAAGEATYRWFPDWDKHHLQAELEARQWYVDGPAEVDGEAIVFKLQRSKERKRVQGRVVSSSTDVGGFYVTLESFQGEREGYIDALHVFTDADGTFSVEVLPDATYCAFALDSRWVGEMIDLIPYQSRPERGNPLTLSMSAGQAAEVVVTSGPLRKPYPNVFINLKREYSYSWRDAEGTHHAAGGPQWWALTDAAGRVSFRTLPGKLNASVYTPLWRIHKEVEVQSGQATRIELHRQVEQKRTVSGRLSLAGGLEASLAGAEIQIGAVDGNCDERQTLAAGQDGSFSFESLAAEIGIFAATKDGRAAAAVMAHDPSAPIDLRLHPTLDYHGQLLRADGQPLAGRGVSAIIHVEGKTEWRALFPQSFEAKRLDAKTDDQGNFTIHGVPREMKVSIHVPAIDQPSRSDYSATIYLQPNESRPRAVIRLENPLKAAPQVSLAKRYQKTLRDCSISGFHVMVILSSEAEGTTRFVERHFVDYETNEDIARFMQVAVARGQHDLDPAEAEFLKKRKWQFPGKDRVAAYAIDASGKEQGRLEVDVTDEGAANKVAEFIHQHAPPQVDAEKKWREAFAAAKTSNRRVWVRISGRYCGPCFQLARWMDDQHKLLEKDYVMLKIDTSQDLNGTPVAEKLTRGKSHGIPFHGIFDRGESLLIDSQGPLGNIGHPGDFEGQQHLRKMLLETRQKLTEAEIEQLIESLGE